uniref:Zinc finger protein 646 n=1 Tax=Oryzias sinensis TaxID=183150 RepID=A0A8C7Y5Q5_9TELE
MADQDLGGASGFPCKQCDMFCPTVSSLLEHMDVHHRQEDERKYKCDECGRCYRHAGSLTNHRRTHEVGPFRCPECGKENANASALKSHLRSHTAFKKYFCGECGKGFRVATQLATHERVHLAQKVKEESSYEFRNDAPHQGREHFSSVEVSLCEDKTEELSNSQFEACDESEERPFKCDMCGKSYIHQRSLNNHKKSHQLGKFECSVCFKLFNNMAALYSHQRSHKAKSGSDFSLTDRSHTGTELDQFSPQSQRAPENFCHLCQVRLSTEEAFQEHIQMHNSSSLSFSIENAPSENHNVSYDGGASPESNLYGSNNCIPSISLDNSQTFGKTACHSNVLTGCSIDQKPHFSSSQGESSVFDSSIDSCTHTPPQNTRSVPKVADTSSADSDERPFKCHVCGKCYRHSGSLINHKRSHQVGVFQCSVCKKNYPHLAALKSHLRLHKTQSTSFRHSAEEDWLTSKHQIVDNQHSSFSFQTEQVGGAKPVLEEPGMAHSDRALYQEQFDQDSSQDTMTHLPQNENVTQRHMCTDCGGTFTDIAQIKSHSCPFLLHQPETANAEYISGLNFLVGNGHRAVGNPEDSVEFHNLNGSHSQSFFKETFHENMSGTQLSNGVENNNPVEEDDCDLYQCSICGNNYSSMRALRCHLRGHTQSSDTPASSGPSPMSSCEDVKEENEGEMMICSACGESFANRLDLINHQILHNKDQEEVLDQSHSEASESKEDQPIICGTCGISCTSYNHLHNHGCTAERGDELVECKQEADNVFKQEETSPRREPDDAEDRQYKCEQCGRSYRHAGSLLNHKKSHKTGLFRCQICQKRFYNLLALKNHQRSHFDIKRYTCHECGKAFKIQKQLLIHMRRHKRNQAKMQELGNQIQALMQMNGSRSDGKLSLLPANANHASASAQHPPQEPEGKRAETEAESSVTSKDASDQRPFACDQCGRTYRHAGSLVNHKNSHKTGEYYCSICNNTYSNQLAMKNHLRTHFLYKRHTCQNCGKGFRGKKQLLAHVCSDLRKDGAAARRVLKSRLIKCKDCKQTFLSVDQLSSHTCDGHPDSGESQPESNPIKEERPFRCNICGRSYRHAGSLLNHKNTHKTGHFSCTFCSKPFTNPMALRNHTRIHTQKKKFVCLTCGKAFRLASILHNHQRIHNRVLSHFSCPSCGRSFQSRSSLRRHHCRRGQGRSVLPGVQCSDRGSKCFTCDLCGRSYRHAGSLLNHKKSHSENLHHCALCLQTFPDSLTLQIHSQMRRHCCPECGKTFCLITHLQSHMEVHSKEQAVVCGLCQQSFPDASSYQQHQSTHHVAQSSYPQATEIPVESSLSWDSVIPESLGAGDTQKQGPPTFSQPPRDISDSQVSTEGSASQEKSHVCEHCGRTYRHAGSLLNHKNSHKTGAFFCSVCHKEFTNLMALKNHRRIHTEPKRYQCLECGKAFRVSTQLICHRRIHTKEKPFTCQLCSKNFSSKSNLRHHQKMHQSSTQTYNTSFSMDSFMDLDMGSFL